MKHITRVYFNKANLSIGNYVIFPEPMDLENWYIADIDLEDLDQFEFIYSDDTHEPLLVRKAPNNYSKFDFEKKEWVTDFTKGNKFLEEKVDNQTAKLYDYIENNYETNKEQFESGYSPIETYLLEYQKANFEGRAPMKLALFLKKVNLTAQEAYDKYTKLKEYIETSKDSADTISYKFYDEANAIIKTSGTFEYKETQIDELFNKYLSENKK